MEHCERTTSTTTSGRSTLVELARPSGQADGAIIDVALPFDVALEQPWGSPSTYVLLGVGSERQRTFCLTLESADRLIAAMRDAVRLARGRT